MAFDPVGNPMHYVGNGRISCMDAMKSMMSKATIMPSQAYWWGCAFKYIWRWPFKNGSQDVRKAIQCLEYLLDCIKQEKRS